VRHRAGRRWLPIALRDRRLRPRRAPPRDRGRHALRLHAANHVRRRRLRQAAGRHAARPAEDARGRARRAVLLDLRRPVAHEARGLLRRGLEAVRRRPRDDPGQSRDDRVGEDRRRRPGQREARADLRALRRGRRPRAAARKRGRDARAPAYVLRAGCPVPDAHVVRREPDRRLLGRRQRRARAHGRRPAHHRRDGAPRDDGRRLARLRSALLGRDPLRPTAGRGT